MRKLSLIVPIIIVALATAAFAAGKLPWTEGNNAPIQAWTPEPSLSRCFTKTVTKGAFANLSTVDARGKSYLGYKWWAVDNTDTPTPVRRHLNTNAAYVPATEGGDATWSSVKSVAFSAPSSASRTITVCTERHP
jgi:hypothetical protein